MIKPHPIPAILTIQLNKTVIIKRAEKINLERLGSERNILIASSFGLHIYFCVWIGRRNDHHLIYNARNDYRIQMPAAQQRMKIKSAGHVVRILGFWSAAGRVERFVRVCDRVPS